MKTLADAQNWAALEDAWLECLASDEAEIEPFLEAATAAAKHDRKKALELLAVLAGELLGRRDHAGTGAALRLAVELAPANPDVRDLVRRLLIQSATDPATADRMLTFSEFDQKPVAEAWDRFEALRRLGLGAYVLHDSWGSGKVVEFETATEEVAVDFASRKGHRMSWAMAIRALTPLPSWHLQALTVDRLDTLMAIPPRELLALAVRSLGGEADPKDVKRLIEPLIGIKEWGGWWATARAEAKNDPSLHIGLAKPMRIIWVEPGAAGPPDALDELRALPPGEIIRHAARLAKDPALRDGVRDVLRERVASLRKSTSLRIEALLVLAGLGDPAGYSEVREALDAAADPADVVLAVRSADLRREAMGLLEAQADPEAVRRELFLRSCNASDWEYLLGRMSEEEKTVVGLEVQRGLPERAAAYFWLVRKADDGFPLPGTFAQRVMRLVDLLDEAAGLIGPVTSYVAESRALQRVAEEGLERAQAVLSFLNEVRLPVSLKEEIRADVYDRFPDLRPAEDVIYSTVKGQDIRAAELKHLSIVELPQNKAALAEAREHGDLRENFEYKAAKEQQERILARIQEIQRDLSRVRLLTPERVNTSVVGPGCAVTVAHETGVEHTVAILGPWESDPDAGVFSYRAPAVQPLLRRQVGDTVLLDLPGISGTFRIVGIKLSDL
ncbi:GreA/GreB family elongation factor [Candidatus Fermentibacteria bacterium]|nr:GreA/GreB family elongation factor [Candidatus Fermentibacteria bacterium]